MNIAGYIFRKIINQNPQPQQKKDLISTGPIFRIAIAGIAIGFIVMLIAVSVLQGFQKEIRDKIIGFGGHLVVTSYTSDNSFQTAPISKDQNFISNLNKIEDISSVIPFALKPGIIRTQDNIEGIVLKGIDVSYNWSFIASKLVEGKIPTIKKEEKTEDILISKQIADKLKIKLNDDLFMFFVQQPPRMRKFKVTGIYQTGLEEYDKLYVFGDMRHVQKLNDWNENMITGYEIGIRDFSKLEAVDEQVLNLLPFNLNCQTVQQLYPQLFEWLNLQNINVEIILVLMLLVCSINMISALLVMILERTTFIGILKSIGANNSLIRKVFLYQAMYLITKGLFWGNIIGIGLCLIQKYLHIISLDQTSYYVKYVPVAINIWMIVALNIGTLVVCSVMMILPTFVITRISPVKAIRFN